MPLPPPLPPRAKQPPERLIRSPNRLSDRLFASAIGGTPWHHAQLHGGYPLVFGDQAEGVEVAEEFEVCPLLLGFTVVAAVAITLLVMRDKVVEESVPGASMRSVDECGCPLFPSIGGLGRFVGRT